MPMDLPKVLLEKYPQLAFVFPAIEEFKELGAVSTQCPHCYKAISVYRDQEIGVIETNCECGYCKYRMKWSQQENKY